MSRDYYIFQPELSSPATKEGQIESWLAAENSSLYQQQLDQERDYCFWCHTKETAKKHLRQSYTSMSYTLTDPSTLQSAGKTKFILREEETLFIHTVSVVRDGHVINKIDDINVKVRDHVTEENEGSFDNEKSITLLIRDLHLNDIFLIETTVEYQYKPDSIRNDFFRYIYTYPSPYWAYSNFKFEVKNETGITLDANFHYFRDEKGDILTKETELIPDGESFTIEEKNFRCKELNDLEIEPFIEFVTKKSYPEITTSIAALYEKFYQLDETSPILAYVADLKKMPDLNQQIKAAIDFVQKEVYYLYNATEMDGYEPQAAEITFKTKQGDCKAKTLLLKVILKYLGVESDIILVNYGADIFLPIYNPSPFNFSHAILKVYLDEAIYFIDATISSDNGLIENRGKPSFMYYLAIKAGTSLQHQSPFRLQLPEIEEVVSCDVKDSLGDFSLTGTMRGRVANNVREMFKNQANKDIVQRFSRSVFNNMALYSKYEENDLDQYFEDARIEIVSDDKDLNELQVSYKAKIKDPYLENGGKRFLHYWDRSHFIDSAAEEHHHRDFPYWVDHNSVKLTIHLVTDEVIDVNEVATCQECDLSSKYINHTVKKNIHKNGADCYIDHQTYHNLVIRDEELTEYIKVNNAIKNNNWGVAIDILPKSVFSKLATFFKQK